MIWRRQRARAVIHSALAVLVIVALSRCAWEDSRELVQRTSLVQQHIDGQPMPIQAPAQGCKESGCICRGATLVADITVDHCHAQFAELLVPPLSDVLAPIAEVPAFSSPADGDSHAPPISGRQLRALYASLVI